jgi:hypothetical protein
MVTSSSTWSSGGTSTTYWLDSSATGTSSTTNHSYYIQFTHSGDINPIVNNFLPDELVLKQGEEKTIKLPDGTIIGVDKDGNFEIMDDNAEVIYKANRIREFNKFINASDLLEEFISFLGQYYNIKQSEVLNVPIELFINWIIIKAAEQDGDPTPSNVQIEGHPALPQKRHSYRCLNCGKFISKKLVELGVNFCDSICMQKKLEANNT